MIYKKRLVRLNWYFALLPPCSFSLLLRLVFSGLQRSLGLERSRMEKIPGILQQKQSLMDQGEFSAAAEKFEDPMRKGAAWFRAGEFEKAERAFAQAVTPEAEYNRGNCLIMQGKYSQAIERFDLALTLRPDWEDAVINRSVAVARAELTKQTGGEMGDQQIGADEIVFDKSKQPGGQETEVQGDQALSDAAVQAMWLRKVLVCEDHPPSNQRRLLLPGRPSKRYIRSQSFPHVHFVRHILS